MLKGTVVASAAVKPQIFSKILSYFRKWTTFNTIVVQTQVHVRSSFSALAHSALDKENVFVH
jgi:hypothetical protein